MHDTAFDPEFDDRDWTPDWMAVPIAPVPAMAHPSGYRVERRVVQETEIFGQPYRLTVPFDCRLLFDPAGRLWMSDTPQERIMMANNARRSCGHVLVGGLGLGLYPQMAAALGRVERFTAIEQSPVVQAIVEPALAGVLSVPLAIRIGDIEDMLAGPVGRCLRHDLPRHVARPGRGLPARREPPARAGAGPPGAGRDDPAVGLPLDGRVVRGRVPRPAGGGARRARGVARRPPGTISAGRGATGARPRAFRRHPDRRLGRGAGLVPRLRDWRRRDGVSCPPEPSNPAPKPARLAESGAGFYTKRAFTHRPLLRS